MPCNLLKNLRTPKGEFGYSFDEVVSFSVQLKTHRTIFPPADRILDDLKIEVRKYLKDRHAL